MFIKRKLPLTLAALMLLSITPVQAKNIRVNREKIESGVIYETDAIVTPYKSQDMGKVANNFVLNFRTSSKEPIDKLKDIAFYLAKSNYRYEVVSDYNQLIPQLEKGVASCYGYTLLSIKLLEKVKIPYKIINIAAKNKAGEITSAHTCLLIQIGKDKWVYFEPTKASFYKEDIAQIPKIMADKELMENTIKYDYVDSINNIIVKNKGEQIFFYTIDKDKQIADMQTEFK